MNLDEEIVKYLDSSGDNDDCCKIIDLLKVCIKYTGSINGSIFTFVPNEDRYECTCHTHTIDPYYNFVCDDQSDPISVYNDNISSFVKHVYETQDKIKRITIIKLSNVGIVCLLNAHKPYNSEDILKLRPVLKLINVVLQCLSHEDKLYKMHADSNYLSKDLFFAFCKFWGQGVISLHWLQHFREIFCNN